MDSAEFKSMTKKLAFLLLVVQLAACGCITNAVSQNGSAPDVKASSKKDVLASVRVGAKFQKLMLEQLMKESKYTAAYGLFSEGGWSNAGQTWVLANQNFSEVKVLKVAPNKDEVLEVAGNASSLSALQKVLSETRDLKNVEETMFDGLIYEFTSIKKTDSDIEMLSNIYIKSTDLAKHPKHGSLVDSFAAL